jgi:glycosyltransferase involved in cell wall biosynthesis
VVGDPQTVFTASALKNKLAFFYRWVFTRELKRQTLEAMSVSYVTKSVLQERYPVSKGAFSTHYSSIELPEYFFSVSHKREYCELKFINILFVGSLSQKYKGLDILLNALSSLMNCSTSFSLCIVGDGRFREEYEQQVNDLGLEERVEFVGYISERERMYEFYSKADLFVLPSLTEGLPRVVIEAMATGLPVIGSRVGGVPELLDQDAMVEPGNAEALRLKLITFFESMELMQQHSILNLEVAEEYRYYLLQERRIQFYKSITNNLLG